MAGSGGIDSCCCGRSECSECNSPHSMVDLVENTQKTQASYDEEAFELMGKQVQIAKELKDNALAGSEKHFEFMERQTEALESISESLYALKQLYGIECKKRNKSVPW